MTKMPCKECGALILPATAKTTGGLCMPCKKGTRKSMENLQAYLAAYHEERLAQRKITEDRLSFWKTSTDISIGNLTVNACNAPAFMGHEEIVIPMLVLGGLCMPKLGNIKHCINEAFQPNDLSNTTISGLESGLSHEHVPAVNLKHMFVGKYDEWINVPEIAAALAELGSTYAFFLEKSPAPFQDAFIARCRFISRNRLAEYHPDMDTSQVTAQHTPAQDILRAFIAEFCREPDYEAVYGDYYRSQDCGKYGDPDHFSSGYAIWLEAPGVIRAWTRIIYVPK